MNAVLDVAGIGVRRQLTLPACTYIFLAQQLVYYDLAAEIGTICVRNLFL